MPGFSTNLDFVTVRLHEIVIELMGFSTNLIFVTCHLHERTDELIPTMWLSMDIMDIV